MTQEEAQQNLWRAHCNFDDPRKAMNIVIVQIYNDHEETTLELMAEVIHQADKVERLKAQLKAKAEEIEMLQCRLYHAEGYIKDIHKPKAQQ